MEKENKILQQKKLKFSIHSCSSFSSSYLPQNIVDDKPSDQASRWSSDTNTPPQFITLKLEKTAVINNITFGKFEKTHVCNLKRFQVLGGLDEDSYLELLDTGLKNDNVTESFSLRHHLNKQFYPINYLKIIPLQSWGPSFNFSIWFVALFGDDDYEMTQKCIKWHKEYKEKETIRLCLKHFRQHNYLEAFESLQKKTKIQLEHPVLTELHSILVKDGDYTKTEELMKKCMDDGIFSGYMRRQHPKPLWTPLILPGDVYIEENITTPMPSTSTSTPTPTTDPDSDPTNSSRPEENQVFIPTQPTARGGHQLVLDHINQNVYLFGGWDGTQDLADFWVYNVQSSKWTQLSSDTESEGGPPPRSCHKMVLDPNYRQIFVLGRYLERGLRDSQNNIRSDFFVYDIASCKWTQITDDTSAMGGPSLIFDHQMCLDFDKRNIYVFGGQSLFVFPTGDERPSSEKKFSGLYVYHIPTNTWTLLWEDGEVKTPGFPPLRSRTGHSMLFNTHDRKLYIFGGQRKRDEYLNDFFTYNIDTAEVLFLSDGNSTGDAAIPAVGYTQRATIDCKRNEIHVMTGLNKDKDKDKRSGEARVSNSFWVYEIGASRWSVIYRNENNEPGYWTTRQTIEPRPRYAHQLVYDEEKGYHYMFGGNPGGKEGKDGRLRLGDFWKLVLQRPQNSDLERFCRFIIKKARFYELKSDPLTALAYLQNELSNCVNHEDKAEEREFQLLAGQIFNQDNDAPNHQTRSDLFDKLVIFFPVDMTQPIGNLLDLIPQESKPPAEPTQMTT